MVMPPMQRLPDNVAAQWDGPSDEEPRFARGLRAAANYNRGRHRVVTLAALTFGIVIGGAFRFLPIAAWFAGGGVALVVLIWQIIATLRAKWLSQEISRESDKGIKIIEPKEKEEKAA